MKNDLMWLDNVIAVPTIGVKMKPWFEYPKAVWDIVSSLNK